MRLKGRKPSEKRIDAAYEELRGLVRARCLALGGVAVPETVQWLHSVGIVVPTRHGALWVWGPHRSEFLTVFARFEEPGRGAVVGANRHSGKWNHHGGTIREGVTVAEVFAAWSLMLDFIKGGTSAEVVAALQAERERLEKAAWWHEHEKADR